MATRVLGMIVIAWILVGTTAAQTSSASLPSLTSWLGVSHLTLAGILDILVALVICPGFIVLRACAWKTRKETFIHYATLNHTSIFTSVAPTSAELGEYRYDLEMNAAVDFGLNSVAALKLANSIAVPTPNPSIRTLCDQQLDWSVEDKVTVVWLVAVIFSLCLRASLILT